MKTLAAPAVAAPSPASTSVTTSARPAVSSTLALLRANSLGSVVHDELERLILDGELAPGAQLIEAALSERLGVSRGPIREAFRRLEETGLVRQEKNRGVFVRCIPLDEALELFDLRAVLDEAVGRRLAQQASAAQIKVLRGLVEQMERLVREGEAGDYHLLNLEFHERLVGFAGNRRMTVLYRRIVNQINLFRRLNLADGALLPTSVSEHRAILKAIAAGDAEAAGRALREHAQDSARRTQARHAGPTLNLSRKARHA